MPQSPKAVEGIQARAHELGINLGSLPAHVAVIMDGNGRWAQKRGLNRLLGHREGYRTLRRALLAASELGIRFLTVYAFSAENWRRPPEEVAGLLHLIEQAAREELRLMHANNVRIRIAGRMGALPEGLRQALEEGVETTRDNSGITFVLAINYGGRAELADAARRLVEDGLTPDQVDEQAIAVRLYNPDIPDPDLMIRTAGEMRWSNFLIWQAAYCELFVTDVEWPEFSPEHLLQAVQAYQTRTRKYGGLADD